MSLGVLLASQGGWQEVNLAIHAKDRMKFLIRFAHELRPTI